LRPGAWRLQQEHAIVVAERPPDAVQLASQRLGCLHGCRAAILRVLDHRLYRIGGVFEPTKVERHSGLQSSAKVVR
jgi:hypothetical protein